MMSELTRAMMDIARAADPHDDQPTRELAEKGIAQFSDEELRELATRELDAWIEHHRRAKARQIERDAHSEASRAAKLERERTEGQVIQVAREGLLADPKAAYVRREDSRLPQFFECISNSRRRKSFMRWAGDRFDEWYERGWREIQAHGTQRELEWFESDWHPDGCAGYYRSKRLNATLELISQVAEETRLQVTDELLATFFALGDGESVTWGDATVEQHQKRLELLGANAAGVIDAAARHEAAIRLLRDSNVSCLNQLHTKERVAA